MNAWICLVCCLVICCDLLLAQAATSYQIELLFSLPASQAEVLRHNVTRYLQEKNLDVYVENVTVLST